MLYHAMRGRTVSTRYHHRGSGRRLSGDAFQRRLPREEATADPDRQDLAAVGRFGEEGELVGDGFGVVEQLDDLGGDALVDRLGAAGEPEAGEAKFAAGDLEAPELRSIRRQ